MIFCSECWDCSKRCEIEEQGFLAKRFWNRYQSSWLFPCGAYYNPSYGFAEVRSGCRVREKLYLDFSVFLVDDDGGGGYPGRFTRRRKPNPESAGTVLTRTG